MAESLKIMNSLIKNLTKNHLNNDPLNKNQLFAAFLVFYTFSLFAPLIFLSSKYSLHIFSIFGFSLITICLLNIKKFFSDYFSLLKFKHIIPFGLIWLVYLSSFLIFNRSDWGFISQVTAGFFLLGTLIFFIDTNEKFNCVLKCLLIFLIINIVVGLLQTVLPFNFILMSNDDSLFGQLIRKPYIPKGLFQSENPFSIFITSALTVFIFTKRFTFFIITMVLIFLLILITDCHGAFMSIICSGLYLFFVSFFIKNWEQKKIYLSKGIIIFMFCISIPNILFYTHSTFSYPKVIKTEFYITNIFKKASTYVLNTNDELLNIYEDRIFEDRVEMDKPDSLSVRKKLIGNSLKHWLSERSYILHGVGAGNSVHINVSAFSKLRNKTVNYIHLHNSFLEILVELGIFAFLFILFYFLYLIFSHIRELSKINDSEAFNLHLGILFTFLNYLIFGGFTLHSIIWNYRDFYLFAGLFLASLLLLKRKSYLNDPA